MPCSDLNIQGYENTLIDDLDTFLDGRLRLDGVDGMESAGNEELTAQTEDRENFFALTAVPWRTEGRFSDNHLAAVARKKSAAHTRISKSSSRRSRKAMRVQPAAETANPLDSSTDEAAAKDV